MRGRATGRTTGPKRTPKPSSARSCGAWRGACGAWRGVCRGRSTAVALSRGACPGVGPSCGVFAYLRRRVVFLFPPRLFRTMPWVALVALPAVCGRGCRRLLMLCGWRRFSMPGAVADIMGETDDPGRRRPAVRQHARGGRVSHVGGIVSQVPAADLRRRGRPGAHRAHHQERHRPGQGEPRLPVHRPARHGQNHHGAPSGQGPAVREGTHRRTRRHLQRLRGHRQRRASGRVRTGRRQPHGRGERARGDHRARAVRPYARPLQGLHHR